MSNYSIALFLHIVGALGFFLALGLEWTGLWQIRSVKLPDRVRAWMGIFKSATRVGFISMLTTVISGIYMMIKGSGNAAWIIITLVSLVLVIGLSLALTRPRMATIGRALVTEKGPFSKTLPSLVNHPLLWISIQTRMAIALGIVFLKIARPDLGGSLLTIAAAIVLGLASALPVLRHEQAQERLVD